jgi:Tfp pilus assembly protein PilF
LIANEWFDRRAAWLSASLAATTGLFTFYEVTFLQASLDVFLTSAFLAALTFGLVRRRVSLIVAAGVICGIQTLNRPNVMLACVLIIFGLMLMRRWGLALALGLGLMLGISPVVARNQIVAGEWSLATSHGGLNFFIGNSSDATGLFRQVPGIRSNILGQAQDTRRVAEASEGRGLSDSEVSAHFTRLGASWIKENPVAWLKVTATKAYYTFHGQHIALPLSYPFFAHDTNSTLGYLFVGPWLLLPLGCFGLVVCAPHRNLRQYTAWVSFVPAYAASVALFFVSERYRLPLLVPITIGAGATVARIWLHLRVGAWRKIARDGAVLVLLGALMNWPLGWIDGDARLEQRIQMAESLADNGDNAGAQFWAARGLPGYPYEVQARLRLARAFAGSGERPLAIEYFESAIALDRSDPAISLELARALVSQSSERRAIEVLNAQPASGGDEPETWLALGRLAMMLRIASKGEQFFSRAVQLAPASAGAREQLGLAQLLLGKYEESGKELSEVVRLDPSNSDAWAHLAVVYFELGQPVEAIRSANAALARQPGHQLALQIKKSIERS